MPNHYRDVIKETAKASDEAKDTFKKKPILWWVLSTAAAVFIISLALYFYHFRNGFSDDQAVWGQFGDFMGGLVNPIVGLLTIGLLTVSLNQSNLALHQTAQALEQSEAALRQSGEEIRLAKQALLDNQKIQACTEAALQEQNKIAANARDMNNAVALYQQLDRQFVGISERLEVDIRLLGDEAEYIKDAKAYLKIIESQRYMLGSVLSIETHRLIQAYCSEEMKQKYDSAHSDVSQAK